MAGTGCVSFHQPRTHSSLPALLGSLLYIREPVRIWLLFSCPRTQPAWLSIHPQWLYLPLMLTQKTATREKERTIKSRNDFITLLDPKGDTPVFRSHCTLGWYANQPTIEKAHSHTGSTQTILLYCLSYSSY